MDFSDRLTWLLIGCLIGYVVRMLQDIKKGLAKVDDHVKERNERGAIRFELVQKVALAVVVLLAFYASVQSQIAANKSNETSDSVSDLQFSMKQNLDCTTQVLFDTVNANNERTTYTTEQVSANIDLVKAQLDLLVEGQDPQLTHAEGMELYRVYVRNVRKFIRIAERNKGKQIQYPYPTVADLTTCLAKKTSAS